MNLVSVFANGNYWITRLLSQSRDPERRGSYNKAGTHLSLRYKRFRILFGFLQE
jgi:hypothetical protein